MFEPPFRSAVVEGGVLTVDMADDLVIRKQGGNVVIEWLYIPSFVGNDPRPCPRAGDFVSHGSQHAGFCPRIGHRYDQIIRERYPGEIVGYLLHQIGVMHMGMNGNFHNTIFMIEEAWRTFARGRSAHRGRSPATMPKLLSPGRRAPSDF